MFAYSNSEGLPNNTAIAAIRKRLYQWYNDNKRLLPWRESQDPYLIWISEVILQQTRIDQGLAYYLRFIDRFPNVQALAAASEDEVLKLWEGLGYYSRGRNLLFAAKRITEEYGGIIPNDYKSLIKLPGIGPYTAAAILSFAYNSAYAAVDGNVYRVLSRLMAIDTPIDTSAGKKEFDKWATALMDKDQAGLHNQAMMEFGALHCTPLNPSCSSCTLQEYCLALKLNVVEQLPKKKGKTKIKERFLNYFFVRLETNSSPKTSTFVRKREAGDVWQGLYEVPLIESEKSLKLEKLLSSPEVGRWLKEIKSHTGADVSLQWNDPQVKLKHILSHQRITAQFFTLCIRTHSAFNFESYSAIAIEDLEKYALPRLIHRALETPVIAKFMEAK